MTREDLPQDAICADGFDDAIIGYSTHDIVCYSYKKCIQILMNEHDMDLDQAIEFLDYNVVGSYVGENTPIFIHE
jgi:hypothetical protein